MSKLVTLKRLLAVPITDGPHETPEFYGSGVPFMSAESIKNGYLDFSLKRGYISDKQHIEYIRKANPQRDDVFMIKSGATTGKVAIVETDEKFSIWSPLALIRANKKLLNPKYLYYSLKSDFFQEQVENSWSFGTQQNIGMQVIENLSIFQHSLETQERQVKLLDEKTAIIDKMITAKNNTHTQLSELRTAIITEFIFGYNVGVVKIKLCRITLSKTAKRIAQAGESVVTLENVQGWTGRLLGYTNPENVTGELVAYQMGDVLFNKLRPYLAKAHIAQSNGLCTGEMLVLRSDVSKLSAKYLYYFLTSRKTIDEINVSTYGVKMPRANWDFIGSLEINLPSLSDQRKIVQKIDDRLQKIDQADYILQKSIAQLEEYRTSLISNVITGKVEV